MADKRIQNLTDEQVTYDPDIYLATDDSTFTNTKKMAVKRVFAKAFTLDEITTINPATELLRLDNGSGAEKKVSITNFLENANVVDLIGAVSGLKLRNGGSVDGGTGVLTNSRGDITATFSKVTTGFYRITHNLGHSNYKVIASVRGTTVAWVCNHSISDNSFVLTLLGGTGSSVAPIDVDINYDMYEYV